MKTLGTVLLLSLIFAGVLRAAPLTREQIVVARDATLSRIVTLLEERHATGLVDDQAVTAARLELAQFRRDTTSDLPLKIEQQTVIVSLHELILEKIRAKTNTGLRSEIDELRATADLLAAQQVLAEMKAAR